MPYWLSLLSREVKVISDSGSMLTLSSPTVCALNVEEDSSNLRHVVSGKLKCDSSGVPNKPIKFFVSDTLAGTATTYGYFGKFNMTLNLPPVDNKPTLYNIKAVFEGDDPRNVTSYLHTPNGTRYAVCTTNSTVRIGRQATAQFSQLKSKQL